MKDYLLDFVPIYGLFWRIDRGGYKSNALGIAYSVWHAIWLCGIGSLLFAGVLEIIHTIVR